ncbi:hypothetical protein H5U98_08910 [Mycolicibacterium boenickei]|uniref:Lipoprotein n=1 Tax=Mycolicibacterium boenickei TaxID=146017 RepID=A0AAX3A1D8_9MYCO|nr:hypothetical protein [Mycolicibacterium boenickei]UNC01477.1 hypothetical protein H5U98_08910 [Mycolicibacterium boenickei]BBX91370.1 hypothetical protein MBOE_30190 [Mycolicibacterium boenickei]
MTNPVTKKVPPPPRPSATDPLLKQVLADTAAANKSIALTLYLPSGTLYGETVSHERFCDWATEQLGKQSGYTGTVTATPDPEYVHLIVDQSLGLPGQESSPEVVRVRLSEVIAWTVG